MTKKQSTITRRRFIRTSAGAISAGLVGKFALAPSLAHAAVSDPHKVVVVSDPQVWLGDGTTDSEIDALRCANMVVEGLKHLTGAADIEAAMRALVPDNPAYSEAKVAIKVNHLNGALPTHYAVLRPIFDALVSLGVQPGNITAYDTRSLKSSAGPFSGNIQFTEYDHNGSSDANWGGSASIVGCNVRWPRVLYEADWMINAAVYKDHSMPAITLCCKNNLGSVNKGASGFPCSGYQLAPLNAHPQLSPHWIPGMGGKCVLYLVDAIYGSIGGDGPGEPVDCAPQRLYFSTDPVNIDHVGWDDMNNIEGVYQANPPHLDPCVDLGLGVRDLARVVRCDGEAGASRADIERKIIEHRSGAAIDDDVKVLIERYRQGD